MLGRWVVEWLPSSNGCVLFNHALPRTRLQAAAHFLRKLAAGGLVWCT